MSEVLPEIVVVGSMFIDSLYDSPQSVGKRPVVRCHGGVGRNIAENLGWLGSRVSLVALSESTKLGREFAAALQRANVHLAARKLKGGLGSFVGLVSNDGEVEFLTSELPPFHRLDWPFVRRHVRAAAPGYVAFESGVNPEMVSELLSYTRAHGIFSCCVPTRMDIFGPQLAILQRADCLIMNREEASLALETPMLTLRAVEAAILRFLDLGPRMVVITLGGEGAAAGQNGSSPKVFPQRTAERVVNTSGCGDAFVAGFLAATAAELGFDAAIEVALEQARRTTEVLAAVRAESSADLLASKSASSRLPASPVASVSGAPIHAKSRFRTNANPSTH